MVHRVGIVVSDPHVAAGRSQMLSGPKQSGETGSGRRVAARRTGVFIGGRLLWELLMLFCREGNGRGSWRLGTLRENPGGAELVTGEPTELDPYESQLRREGMEFSLGSVGLRDRGMVGGGESGFCEASIGW
jgi:hypothetical protein